MLKINLDIDNPNFGKEARAALGYLGMSQSALAKELGVSPQYVIDTLSGKRNYNKLKPKIAKKLTDIFYNS